MVLVCFTDQMWIIITFNAQNIASDFFEYNYSCVCIWKKEIATSKETLSLSFCQFYKFKYFLRKR